MGSAMSDLRAKALNFFRSPDRFIKSPVRLALTLAGPVVVVLAVLVGVLAVWEAREQDAHFREELEQTARAYFSQVLITRLWNARHGGVYILLTGDVQPNPYLDDPRREIVTEDGLTYTKVNPSYMTREISELARDLGSYRFHLTSLRPVNPGNAPDAWEAAALRGFEGGTRSARGIDVLDGARYYRYMEPLFVTEECMGCHARHGYSVGQIRGGLSVSIPVAGFESIQRMHRRDGLLALGMMGSFAALAIVVMAWLLSVRMVEAVRREVEGERLRVAVEMAGAAAHEMRQPMTVIIGLCEMIKAELPEDDPLARELDVIVGQCYRMDGIIKRMLSVTEYRTRAYTEDTSIFDLTAEGEKGRTKE
jgi:hypothetical protein